MVCNFLIDLDNDDPGIQRSQEELKTLPGFGRSLSILPVFKDGR